MIDIGALRYELTALLRDGTALPLRRALLGLQWEEQPNELAVRLTAALYNASTTRGLLHQVIGLGAWVHLAANWGEGRRTLFVGEVVDWRFTSSGEAGDSIEIVAYDPLWRLAASEDQYLWPLGTPATTALRRMFSDWSIPEGIISGPNVDLPKMTIQGSLADGVFQILTTSWLAGATANEPEYLIRSRYDDTKGMMVVDVVPVAQNAPLYHLRADRNLLAYSDSQSIGQLVTELHLVSQEGEGGDSPVPAVDESTTPVRKMIDIVKAHPDPEIAAFGRLRAILVTSEQDQQEEIDERAAAILDERGYPKREVTFTAPDLPFLRRGDRLRITAGTMDREIVVCTGIQHDADSRTMQITVDSGGSSKFKLRRFGAKGTSAKTGLPSLDEPGFS